MPKTAWQRNKSGIGWIQNVDVNVFQVGEKSTGNKSMLHEIDTVIVGGGQALRQLSPLKGLAEVGEVADLLLYLESAKFIKGEVVQLDGGAHAGNW